MNTKQVKIIVGENEHEYDVVVEVSATENVKDIITKATQKVIGDIEMCTKLYNLTGNIVTQKVGGEHSSIETTTRYIKQ